MNQKVLVATIPGMIESPDLDRIREKADLTYIERDKIELPELTELCYDIDVLMLNYDIVGKLTEDFLRHPNIQQLTTISTDITGMDWAKPKLASELGITLQHIPHYSSESVAETIVCEVFMHARKRPQYISALVEGTEPDAEQGFNLRGRSASVIGLGSIGRRVYDMLEAVGMEMSGWSRTKKDGYRQRDISECISADVVCICASTVFEGSDKNIGFIDGSLLNRCNGSVIVNLAGEFLVDNDAMWEAIQDGRVTGYSVERSKSTLDAPFATEPCVSLPPKNSWKSQESLDNLKNIWVENTLSALSGNPENIYSE